VLLLQIFNLFTYTHTIENFPFYHLELKGIIHPKMEIQSSFIQPQVVSNLYGFLYSQEQKMIFKKKFQKTTKKHYNID